MQALTAYVQTIQDAHPELVIHTVRSRTDGQNSDIVIVNDEFIFRFPRYPHGVAALATEVAVLKFIHHAVPLAVPDPLYTSSDMNTVGRTFMGYRMLRGEPLWRETLAAINDRSVVQRLAAQLASFLKALHAVPVEPLRADVPVHDHLGMWRTMYDEIEHRLFPLMRADARAQVAHHFQTFLNTPRLHQYPLALRHGDFGTSNILYDPVAHTISGIIDWGSAAIGDPVLDLAALGGHGSAFFDQVCAAYGVNETMLERARFYQGTYALQEALHGIKHNDRDAFESGIAAYV